MSSDVEKDFQLIQNTLENYFTGVIEGNYSKIVKAWHTEGNRMLVESSTNDIIFLNSPASDEYASLKPRPEIKQTARIEAIDKTGAAASVRLKWFLESPRGTASCTDYLLLLKERESWTIVTKVSHKE
ncbi:MAG: nuclear transport factor 2 family protein [Candidatus Hodarchaeota archaeon]